MKNLSPSIARTYLFTYGTLMLEEQMRGVTRRATAPTPAVLRGYKPVVANIGYGSVEPHSTFETWGVLWRVDDAALAALDAYETKAYIREELPVYLASGKAEIAWVYSVRQKGAFGVLHPGILSNTIVAALRARLPVTYIEKVLIPSLAHGV